MDRWNEEVAFATSTKESATTRVGERVPTGVRRRDDPEGDLVEATRRYW